MSEKFADKTAPRPPRCAGCAQPMQLLRRTPRFDGLPDLYSFYCCTCDQWHVEEADAAMVPPSNSAAWLSSAAIRH